MAIISIFRRVLIHQLSILRLELPKDEPFLKKNNVGKMIFQCLLISMSPLPFLGEKRFCMMNSFAYRPVCYGYNDVFHILQFGKLYFLVKAFITGSVFASSSSYRMCSIYGLRNTDTFVVKCMMKEVPIKLISAIFLSGIMFFGYALRIAEAPLYLVDNTINLTDYFTCCWTAMLTMTTVGYGDYYPRTTLGRLIMLVCCVYGMVVVSLMVNFVSQELSLSQSEVKAYTVIKRLQKRKELKKEAGAIIGKLGKYNYLKNRDDSKASDRSKILQSVISRSKELDNMNAEYKAIHENNAEEDIERNFALINSEMNHLKSIMYSLKLNIKTYVDKKKSE
jgi:potassium intermediate/small conductance calcium-activated channel subfamily N protein 2